MEDSDTNFPEENPETTVWELMTQKDMDPLTDLPNRRRGEETLQKLINRAAMGKQNLALFYLDGDSFGIVNKKYGQPYGDQIMVDFAFALKESIRPTDFLVREAGDEFYVIALDYDRKEDGTEFEKRLNEKIHSKLISRDDYSKHPELGKIGVTLGLGFYQQGDTPRTLIGRAEEVMRANKRKKFGKHNE